MLMLRSLNLFGGTRRYHRDYSDAGVPVGTTGLIQMLDLSDTGVPVGTTEQIRYGQNLIKCKSTRRYYRTDPIPDRTYSDTGLVRYRSTRRYYRTDQIRTELNQMQEYP